MSKNKNDNDLLKIGTTLTVIGIGSYLFSRYKICLPNQYLVKTGLGISDVTISKKGIVYPFQKYQMINMNPRTFSFQLHHMSKEKVPFNLPVVFTVSPHNPIENLEYFKNYTKTMTNIEDSEIFDTIKSVIHGETRILSADLNVDELFRDREKFKHTVSDKIQIVLNQFGLKINNANIEEIQDLPGSEIFKFLRLKATEGINNASRVDVAEAKKIGDIGEQERRAFATQKLAQFNSETIAIQNSRNLEIAESTKNLEVAKAEFSREVEMAKLVSIKTKELKEAELQSEIEKKKIQLQTESLRSKELVDANVKAESIISTSSGQAESRKKLADAELYANRQEAEAIFLKLDAEAKGMKSKLLAEAEGMRELLSSCGGDSSLLQFNLAIRSNLYPELAKQNALAVNGM